MVPHLLTRVIPATVHGRYLVELPEAPPPYPLLVGFHGYGETAERHLACLRLIPGATGWALCAIQALHPFYTKANEVVASWMTRLDREEAIADNVEYVSRAVARVKRECEAAGPLVYAGFSQGVAMAYRAAAGAGHHTAGLIVHGGDVPPELAGQELRGFPPVLLGCGQDDQFYASEKFEADRRLLESKGVDVQPVLFQGGHEWSAPFLDAAGAFLDRVRRQQ